MVSWKYSKMSASDVAEDFQQNHRRAISRGFIQELSEAVAVIASEKESQWIYALPEMPDVVARIVIGRDGAMTPILGEGYREAMNATIALHNSTGERMHTIYMSCAPEYGKASFESLLDMEIARVTGTYPTLLKIGLADGAKDNWTYFATRTDLSIVDFFHATEYLSKASPLMASSEQTSQQQTSQQWLQAACHHLKHAHGGAADLLDQMKHALDSSITPARSEELQTAITYFSNNLGRMNYASYLKKHYPIGSGVTEAACKIMVKQRLCGSGMRWTTTATDQMLLLRGLTLTNGRWSQFWQNIDRLGF